MPTYSIDELFQMSKGNSVPNNVLINLGDYGASNLVSYDERKDKETPLTFAVKLLNWVEPYEHLGVEKTLFWTEVSSNVKVGDKVFIINGFYDSNEKIKQNKYKTSSEGYSVLYVDNCKVALDIDFINVKPFKDDDIEDYVKVFRVKSQLEFDYINKEITTKNDKFDFKYNQNNDYIAYIDTVNYNGINEGFGMNLGVSTGPGFYIKNGDQAWINITNDFISGSFSIAQASRSNDKIRIVNGDIDHNGLVFKESLVYKYDSNWVVDNSNTKELAILTKSNFRKGIFTGEFNAGVYGSQDLKINWEGVDSTWNNGTLFNSVWKSGMMNSKYELPVSYIADFDKFGNPFQKIDSINNSGFGFNYVINSEFELGTMSGANLNNSVIGDPNVNYSIIEDYLLGIAPSYTSYLNNVTLINTRIVNSKIDKCLINNSRVDNSLLTNTKSINSQVKKSVFQNSSWNSEGIIKLLGYEYSQAAVLPTISSTYSIAYGGKTHMIYKFYISRQHYMRLRSGDFFYIKNIKVKDGYNNVLNFFNKKFKVGTWLETQDVIKNDVVKKARAEYSVFLSSFEDNKYKLKIDNLGLDYWTTIENYENINQGFSVDVWIKMDNQDDFDIVPDTIELDVESAYIVDSYIDGLFYKSDWNSGDDINYNFDYNLNNNYLESSTYSIYVNANDNFILEKNEVYSYINKESYTSVGDILYMDVDNYDGVNYNRLSDTYKVIDITNGYYELRPLTQSLTGLTGPFMVNGAYNRYGYLSKLKIDKSKIKSGIFKRSHIKNTLIQDPNYSSNDKDYNNMDKIRNLVLSEVIFSNKSNILGSATYLNSHFVKGSDKWIDGIIDNSIWNGMDFSNGVFKNSSWVNGNFNGGLFYNNRTFDLKPGTFSHYYYSDNIKNWYKDGRISVTMSNDRYSWRTGEFNGGEFYKSDWENGSFNGGKFYNANWYDGYFKGGVFGDDKVFLTDTQFFSGTFSDGVVVNSMIYSEDTSLNKNIPMNITWENGIFQSGLYGCSATSSNTWKNGIFNSGDFVDKTKWENGIFNGGNFLSTYGLTSSEYNTYVVSSDLNKINYSWENGIFNGGFFGSADGLTNSTWFDGEFRGGIFQGRKWNKGVFVYGDFNGSATQSSVSMVDNFMTSYTSDYYGLWVSGYVTENKDRYVIDKKVESNLKRNKEVILKDLSANINNSLWIDGIVSHNSSNLNNVVWLSGGFEKGIMNQSSFNPYVDRPGSNSNKSFQKDVNGDRICYWNNGKFIDSNFYYSEWDNGEFISGTAYGMIYHNGVTDYMNAYNVYWENGIWRNGNWYGSHFILNHGVDSGFDAEIISRINEYTGVTESHVWNIFEGGGYFDNGTDIELKNPGASELTEIIPSPVVTCSNVTTTYNSITLVGTINSAGGNITGSGFLWSTTPLVIQSDRLALPTINVGGIHDLSSTATNTPSIAYTITPLSSSTTYYLYMYAKYNNKYYMSSACTKATQPPSEDVFVFGSFRDLYTQGGVIFDDYVNNEYFEGDYYVPGDKNFNNRYPVSMNMVKLNIENNNNNTLTIKDLDGVSNIVGFSNDKIETDPITFVEYIKQN